MKRKKTLLVLCTVLLVAIIGIVAEHAFQKHVDAINKIDEEVFKITADDVTKLAVTKDGSTATFEKKDDTWTNTSDADFPVNQDYVKEMLSKFESIHASFIIDNVEDYSQYGLDSPEGKIVFTTADGDKVITFGAFSTLDTKRYICVDGGSVYLIDTDLLENISGKTEDYLDRDSVYNYSQLTALKASGASKLNLVYDPDGKYSYTDTYNYYDVDGEEHKALSDTKVTSYLNTLTNMNLSEYETYKASEEDLKKYGLDEPTLTLTIKGEVPADDSDDKDAEVKSKKQKIYFSYKDKADYAYVNFDGSTIIYKISSDTYDEIVKANYESLRPDEIVSIDWTTVSQISTKIDGKTYIVDVKTDKNDGNTYTLDGENLKFTTVTTKIDGLYLDKVGEDYKKGTEELSFAITLNDDNATMVNVVMYQYDGDSCVAAVDGKVVGLCSRSSMSNLREEITSSILNKGKED